MRVPRTSVAHMREVQLYSKYLSTRSEVRCVRKVAFCLPLLPEACLFKVSKAKV